MHSITHLYDISNPGLLPEGPPRPRRQQEALRGEQAVPLGLAPVLQHSRMIRQHLRDRTRDVVHFRLDPLGFWRGFWHGGPFDLLSFPWLGLQSETGGVQIRVEHARGLHEGVQLLVQLVAQLAVEVEGRLVRGDAERARAGVDPRWRRGEI